MTRQTIIQATIRIHRSLMHNLLKIAGLIILAAMLIFPFVSEKETKQRVDEKTNKKANVVNQTTPDFSSFTDVNEKKKAFFDFIRPAVNIENDRIAKERTRLIKLQGAFESDNLLTEDIAYAKRLGNLYLTKVTENGLTPAWFEEMLNKVNVIPDALVLTQAANESAWGTSRFARQANNYFGQWCYKKGCGLVPLQRTEGAIHEVAKFASMSDSVYAYFMNVNRNKAYASLRSIREALEADNQDLSSVNTATQLTNGLLKYSERGQAYVDDLQTMIRVNNHLWTSE